MCRIIYFEDLIAAKEAAIRQPDPIRQLDPNRPTAAELQSQGIKSFVKYSCLLAGVCTAIVAFGSLPCF